MRIMLVGMCVGTIVAASAFATEKIDWGQILAPSPKVQFPPPMEAVKWRSDLGNAMEQARRENRPLFVTLRCLPCKQCSAFDKDVLEGGPLLDPLLRQF